MSIPGTMRTSTGRSVRCVEPEGMRDLTKGKVYTALDWDPGKEWVDIEENDTGARQYYFSYRFAPVGDATPVPTTAPPTDYEAVAAAIARTVVEKQAAYGDSFGKSGQIVRVLYPDGVKPEQYDDFLATVRLIDKLFRVATKKDAFGESPWDDAVGYCLLAATRSRRDAGTPTP